MIRKYNNHTLQTNPCHHEEKADLTLPTAKRQKEDILNIGPVMQKIQCKTVMIFVGLPTTCVLIEK